MAKVQFSILSKNVIVDKKTNQLSIINILEEAQFTADPLPQPNEWTLFPLELQLVTMFIRSDPEVPEHTEARIRVSAPSGEIFTTSVKFPVSLTESRFNRNITRFSQTPIFSTGQHDYIIDLLDDNGEWNEAFRAPVFLTLTELE